VQNSISENLTVVLTETIWNRCPKWERRLPSKLVIALAEDSSTSLKLKVELETTDTGEVKSVNSFMDSGATREFIDHHYTKSNRLHTWKLSKPMVYKVDRTLNEAGSITEVVDLILRYWNHSERTLFIVTGLGKQKLILRHSWLRKHKPEIDWVPEKSKCPDVHPDAVPDVETKLECRESLGKQKSDGWKLSPMGLYQNSTQTLKRKSPKKLKKRSNQEILSLQLALFQHQQISKPLPVFLSA